MRQLGPLRLADREAALVADAVVADVQDPQVGEARFLEPLAAVAVDAVVGFIAKALHSISSSKLGHAASFSTLRHSPSPSSLLP